MNDDLIKSALSTWLTLNDEPKLTLWDKIRGRKEIEIWLPTATLRLFEVLRDYVPRGEILLADFDYLPSTVPGINGPIVQRRDGKGGYLEYDTVTVEAGSCDIFFPTDFELLKAMYFEVSRLEALNI